MRALFDTNVLIDYLSGSADADKEIQRWPDRAVSLITWMEVLVGARDDEEEDVVDLFLRDFRVVDVTRQVARAATRIRRQHRMRLPDAIIWATAHAESALLITRNTKDFPKHDPTVRVPY